MLEEFWTTPSVAGFSFHHPGRMAHIYHATCHHGTYGRVQITWFVTGIVMTPFWKTDPGGRYFFMKELLGQDLVGGLEHVLFSIIYGIILSIDELIFFKMVKTTKQLWSNQSNDWFMLILQERPPNAFKALQDLRCHSCARSILDG